MESFKRLARALLGWAAAIALLFMLPMVFPYMSYLNRIRKLFHRKRTLEKSVVIITGASSGIGSDLAIDFARRGAKLVLAARREGRLRQVAEACMQQGALAAEICPADVTKDEDCLRIVEFALTQFGRIDVLVNNAGTAHTGYFEELNLKELHQTMELDFFASVNMTRHCLEHLRRSRGHLVVTGSVAAFVPYPRQAIYNAAKGAIAQFFDTLRTEPVARVVDITVALPGFVESELTLTGPKGHIPWWWPMLSSEAASRAIVEAIIKRERYAIVPPWYVTWLPYRIFAPELMEWMPRMFLLGKPPSRLVETACTWLLGEVQTRRLFATVGRLAC